MPLGDTELAKFKQQLLDRLSELQRHTEVSADSRKPVVLDQTSVGRLSRMDAMQQQAMAQAGERRRSLEVSKTRAALVRLEQGDFGYCIKCDEEISPKRLDVDPTTSLCIQCAQ
jgi:DnaK suppressor protein